MRPWDVWFANFPHEEDPATVKPRPVVIFRVEPLEVLSVKVTSQAPRDDFDVPIVGWASAGLDRESCASVSKVIFLTPDKFTRKLGHLENKDQTAILNKYTEFLQQD